MRAGVRVGRTSVRSRRSRVSKTNVPVWTAVAAVQVSFHLCFESDTAVHRNTEGRSHGGMNYRLSRIVEVGELLKHSVHERKETNLEPSYQKQTANC